MKTTPRSSFIGAAVGAVVLAVLVGFVLVLPHDDSEATAAPAAASASLAPAAILPDKLSNGMHAVDVAGTNPTSASGTAGAGAQTDTVAKGAKQSETYSIAGLSQVFGTGAQVRFYADDQIQNIVRIVEIDAAPGPFLPDGPPSDPSLQSLARGNTELRDLGDAVCATEFSSTVPAGQTVPTTPPDSVSCQLKGTAATWQISAGGITGAQAVALLQSVADAAPASS